MAELPSQGIQTRRRTITSAPASVPTAPSTSQPKRGGPGSRGGRGGRGGRRGGRGSRGRGRGTQAIVSLEEPAPFVSVPYNSTSTSISLDQQTSQTTQRITVNPRAAALQPSFNQPPIPQQVPFSQTFCLPDWGALDVPLEPRRNQGFFPPQDSGLFLPQFPDTGSQDAGSYSDGEDDQTTDKFLGEDPIAYEDDSDFEGNTTIRPATLPPWLVTQPNQSSAGAWNHQTMLPPTLPSLSRNDNQQPAPLTRVSEHSQTTLRSDTDQAPLLTFRSGDGGTQIDPRELQRRLVQPTHIMSGPQVDILAASTSRRSSRMPTLEDLFAIRSLSQPKSPSVVSESSSVVSFASSANPPSQTSQQSSRITVKTRAGPHGLARQYHSVQRRTRDDLPYDPSPVDSSADDIENLNIAFKTFVTNLLKNNAWPTREEASSLVNAACEQANVKARMKGRRTTEFTKARLKKVKHTGSLLRSSLKSTIFNSLHLWGILPSAEQQATMTPAEYQQFVADGVARVLVNKGYLSTGTDSNGNPAHYNHPALHSVINTFFFGKKGVSLCYPEEFRPKFPTPALALTSTLLRIVLGEVETGLHLVVRLDENHQKGYVKEHALLHKMVAHTDYHQYFMTAIQKKIMETGLTTMGLVGDGTQTMFLDDDHVDFSLKLPEGFNMGREAEATGEPGPSIFH